MQSRRPPITATEALTVMMAGAVASAAALLPALWSEARAEGRHDSLLSCHFASGTLAVVQEGGGYAVDLSGVSVPATLGQTVGEVPLVSVVAMTIDGPLTLAVAATPGAREHPADLTRTTLTKTGLATTGLTTTGLATTTLHGTCMEATP